MYCLYLTLNVYPLLNSCFVGYEGAGNEWDDYSRFVNQDGVDMTSVIFFILPLLQLFYGCFDPVPVLSLDHVFI